MDLYALIKPYKTLSIIGMCKNAGKTTVLNALLRTLKKEGSKVAVTSVGRDGERVDVVTGTDKPPIFVARGTLVATAERLLPYCDITKEIVDTTDIHTPLGRVILLRALSDGYVELAGPSMVAQIATLNELLIGHGADLVIIDGAISRKSLAQPAIAEAVILCTGASYNPDMDRLVEDTLHAAELLTLKKHRGEQGLTVEGDFAMFIKQHPDTTAFRLHGALTDNMMRALLQSNIKHEKIELTVQDGSRILLSTEIYDRCKRRGISLSVDNETKLILLCVNPRSVTGGSMDGVALKNAFKGQLAAPVCNVMEDIDEAY